MFGITLTHFKPLL